MASNGKVKLRVPKDGGEDEVLVGVNGVMYRIRKGVEVEVPESVAEVLRNADIATDRLDAWNEERKNRN